MPGTSGGTGSPLWFRCAHCRRLNPSHNKRNNGRGYSQSVQLTGKKRQINDGMARSRSSNCLREYKCGDCGHRGWSRHVDLGRKDLGETG